MPQLTVRGIDISVMKAVSAALLEELAAICECGTDNFTIDCLLTASVFDGKKVDTFPFVEIAWFERGTPTRDRVADAVARHVRSAGVAEVEIAFKVYREDAYYINGISCAPPNA